jgi:hypothetical protein
VKNRPSIVTFCIIIATIGLGSTSYAGWKDVLKQVQESLTDKQTISEDEIIGGLKEALQIGTKNTVQRVSVHDGYFRNPKIKIPLPESVQKTEAFLRSAGIGGYVDDFELSMNRAAERAAPQAKKIFLSAIRQMTFADARQILEGHDNAATLYFKSKTYDDLQLVFQPPVHEAMNQVGVTRIYRNLNDQIRRFPFLDSFSFDLDQYVTSKALDGLFLILSEEEKKIREDPAARVTDLLQKVFGN